VEPAGGIGLTVLLVTGSFAVIAEVFRRLCPSLLG
jgi:hypothetical protein